MSCSEGASPTKHQISTRTLSDSSAKLTPFFVQNLTRPPQPLGKKYMRLCLLRHLGESTERDIKTVTEKAPGFHS